MCGYFCLYGFYGCISENTDIVRDIPVIIDKFSHAYTKKLINYFYKGQYQDSYIYMDTMDQCFIQTLESLLVN